MKKRLAVVFKLIFLIVFFSVVFASAESYYDSFSSKKEFVNTGPVENIDYCNYCKSNYYQNYEKPYKKDYLKFKDKYYEKYLDYKDRYYCKPKFTDYQERSYGHGLQLVRFRLDNYYNDYPNYKHYSYCDSNYDYYCYKTDFKDYFR